MDSFMIFCLFISLTYASTLQHRKLSSDPANNVCLSPECTRAAASVLRYMDTSENPCEDFFKYMCGGFRTGLYEHESGTVRDQLHRAIERTIVDDLATALEEHNGRNFSKMFQNAAKFQHSCMNHQLTSLSERPFEYRRLALELESEGIPVGRNRPIQMGLSDLLARLHDRGMDFPWLVVEHETVAKTDNKYLVVSFPKTRSIELLHNETLINPILYGHITNDEMSPIMKAKKTQDVLLASLNIEIAMMKILKKIANKDAEITFGSAYFEAIELETNHHWLTWSKVLKHYLGEDPSMRVVAKHFAEFSELFSVLDKQDPTDVANALLATYIHHMVSNKEVVGSEKLDHCLGLTKKHFGNAIGEQIASDHITPELRNQLEEVASNVKDQLLSAIDKGDWLNEESRANAAKKASNINVHIAPAYPNDRLCYEKYEALHLNKSNFGANIVKVRAAEIHTSYHSRCTGIEDSLEGFAANHQLRVAATYFLPLNDAFLSTARVFAPLAFEGTPAYFKYGRSGYVIGHELSHAFDSDSSQFDHDFNFNAVFTDDDDSEFKDRVECFRSQYNSEFDERAKSYLNGDKTIGENIADTSGIHLAYQAFMKTSGVQMQMPGLLDRSSEQLFFMSMASSVCSHHSDAELRRRVTTSTHLPWIHRVNHMMRNLPQFATAFNCPRNSTMNPDDRCTLWR